MRATRCFLVVLALCLPGTAQTESKTDVFGGYSYLSVGSKYLDSRQSLNGWESSLSVNVSKLFAVEGDVGGHYKSVSADGVSATVSDYTFAGGPRVNFRPVFAHVLVGGDRVGASAFGFAASHTGLSVAAGGGIQWPVSNHWSARVSADYVYDHHNVSIPGVVDTSLTLNNVRVGAGIVYSFGGGRPRSTRPRQESRPAPTSPKTTGEVNIPQLGIGADNSDTDGAAIVSVTAGSPSDRAGLRPSDVIKAVDGVTVRSPQELAAALAVKPTGATIKIRYLRRYWESETSVTLP
jgi:hypothetical protein